MDNNLLLHPNTEKRVAEYLLQPATAILISGQPGSGKTAVAKLLAAMLLDITRDKLIEYPYFLLVERPEDKQEIPIDSIRQIIKELRLKPVLAGSNAAKRVVLIRDAGKMSEEAQNALLKSIEEPPANTFFILTADSETSVLPTIASRAQKLPITPVGAKEAGQFFSSSHSPGTIESARQLSQGAAGLMSALLADDRQHPLKQAVDEAKSFLRMDIYERIIFLDSLSGEKQHFGLFLDALCRTLAALHSAAVDSDNTGQAKRLAAARRLATSAAESLGLNTSARLIALNLALNLPV